jgi:hypothetical protein
MPWQECSKVDQRLRFVARLLEGGDRNPAVRFLRG